MRIVMPLFDFNYQDTQEFVFEGGKYALRYFDVHNELPEIDLFSKQDVGVMEFQPWALVAENSDLNKYKEEINILLLSFKICKSSRLFIKYRLCKEDINLCRRLNETMHYVSPEIEPFTLEDLKIINNRFSNLLEMDTISNRTHNAMYFMFREFLTGKMIGTFIFLMAAIESLFSGETSRQATKTICTRLSKFLGSKTRCEYKDIERLYNIRSKIVHGRVVVNDEIKGQLPTLYELEYVLRECIKKMLDEKIYPVYGDIERKEEYFNKL
jgi:hypothetical protein